MNYSPLDLPFHSFHSHTVICRKSFIPFPYCKLSTHILQYLVPFPYFTPHPIHLLQPLIPFPYMATLIPFPYCKPQSHSHTTSFIPFPYCTPHPIPLLQALVSILIDPVQVHRDMVISILIQHISHCINEGVLNKVRS